MNTNIFKLDYSDAIHLHYAKWRELPGFVLLESVDRQNGRYDILSAYPYDKCVVKKEHDSQIAFDWLKQTIRNHPNTLDLPFQGGAIGYFSYDLACLLSGIDIGHQQDLTEMPLMDMGLYDWALIVDHHLKKAVLFSANTQTDTPGIVEYVQSLWHAPLSADTLEFSCSTLQPFISRTTYEQAFHKIHADIRRGRCYQVNYTQPFIADYTGEAWAIYEAIRGVNPVPFSAYLRSENAEVLSFSPERFVQMDNGHLLTSPIKGTAKRSADPSEDQHLQQALKRCPKNRAENVMIVDLMRNDFGKIARPGSVEVQALCNVESYPAVHHLVSHITAEAKADISPIDAFMRCFPGGSITGTPKLEAMTVIAEQETATRGVYCGNIGYFSNHGRFDTNIAIRTLTAKQNQLYLSVGGALVFDSECEDEYQECLTKIKGISRGLK